jgi:hypothetical protein
MTSGQDTSEYLDTLGLVKSYFVKFFQNFFQEKKIEKNRKNKMSGCTDAPEDEAISLFAGLLANPDVPLILFVSPSRITKNFPVHIVCSVIDKKFPVRHAFGRRKLHHAHPFRTPSPQYVGTKRHYRHHEPSLQLPFCIRSSQASFFCFFKKKAKEKRILSIQLLHPTSPGRGRWDSPFKTRRDSF